MEIRILTSLKTDNFFYAVAEDGDLLLVDPIDPAVALALVAELSPQRVRILNTHWHWDHIEGNERLVSELGCEVLASGHAEIDRFHRDVSLWEGEFVEVGKSRLRVEFLPGHTHCLIGLSHGDDLISGDCVFVAGVGNCNFGGDVRMTFHTVTERLARFSDATRFYPGHDYSVKNLEFMLSIAKGDAEIEKRLALARTRSRADGPLISTLGEERKTNLFFRTREPEIVQQIRSQDGELWDSLREIEDEAERAFTALRSMRDHF